MKALLASAGQNTSGSSLNNFCLLLSVYRNNFERRRNIGGLKKIARIFKLIKNNYENRKTSFLIF